MTNADLSFMTLDYARELPERLEESAKVSQAVGVLIALRGWDPQVARQRLRAAAAKARIGVEQVATVILDLGVTWRGGLARPGRVAPGVEAGSRG